MRSRLEQLEAAATPGPWSADFVRCAIRHLIKNVDPENYTLDDSCHLSAYGSDWSREDAPFIAALRNAAPALLAVVEAARHLRDNCDVYGGNEHIVIPAVVALDKALAKLDEVQP